MSYRLGHAFIFFAVLLALLLRVELAAKDNTEVFRGLLDVVEAVAIALAGAQFSGTVRAEVGDFWTHIAGKVAAWLEACLFRRWAQPVHHAPR